MTYAQPSAAQMLCEALANSVACAAVSFLVWRNCRTMPSNTRSDLQAICGRLFVNAALATSSGALSATLTADGAGNPITLLIKPLSCVSASGVTVTAKPQLVWSPAPSVAVQVTGVVPRGNVDPELGVQLVIVVLQLSLAVGEKVTGAPLVLLAVAV